jgi:hypothetical protein
MSTNRPGRGPHRDTISQSQQRVRLHHTPMRSRRRSRQPLNLYPIRH